MTETPTDQEAFTAIAEESPQASGLVGAILQQSARDLAFTTDRLLEHKDRIIGDLASTIVQLDNILSAATVIDRVTEDRLAMLGVRIEAAYRHLPIAGGGSET